MPRRKAGFQPLPKPYQAREICSVSVYQPTEMLDILKDMAATRELQEKARVPIRQLYDEAVQGLLVALRHNRPVFFSPTPVRGATRRTIWIYPKTMEELKAFGKSSNLHLSQLVLTALIQYTAKRGITFEGFPTSFDDLATPQRKS